MFGTLTRRVAWREALRLSRAIAVCAAIVHSSVALAADGMWSTYLTASNRAFSPIVCDAHHGRLFMFGGWRNASGETSADLYVRPIAGARAWQRVDVTGPRPSARYGHCMVYDGAHEQLVLFGGATRRDGVALGDAWTLSLEDSLVWRELHTDGPAPGPRLHAAAAFDERRHRLLIVGGFSSLGASEGDTWALSLDGTPAWSRLNQAVPSFAICEAGAAYDPDRDRLMVFGGIVGQLLLGSAIALPLATPAAWESLAVGASPRPAPRAFSAVAYDTYGKRLLVLGGLGVEQRNGSSYLSPRTYGELWSLSSENQRWTRLLAADSLAFYGQGVAYVAATNTLVAHGGLQSPYGFYWAYEEPWPRTLTLTLDHEIHAASEGAFPLASASPLLLLAPDADTLLLSGGELQGYDRSAQDLASLELSTDPQWQLSPPAPLPAVWPLGLARAAAAYDPVDRQFVVYAGERSSYSRYEPLRDLWTLATGRPDIWRRIDIDGETPAGRSGASLTYDPVGNRFVLFGGDLPQPTNAVWSLSLWPRPQWTPLPVTANSAPAPRAMHLAAYDATRRSVIVLGGETDSTTFADVWAFTLDEPHEWVRLTPEGEAPRPRGAFVGGFDPARPRFVFVGVFATADSVERQVWELSLGTRPAWRRLETARDDILPDSRGTAAVWDGRRQRLLLWGGLPRAASNERGELLALNLDPLTDGSPVARAAPWVTILDAPSSATLRIRTRWPATGNARLDLLDVRGRRVRTLAIEHVRAGWIDDREWNMSGLASGMYVVCAQQGETVARRRVVVLPR